MVTTNALQINDSNVDVIQPATTTEAASRIADEIIDTFAERVNWTLDTALEDGVDKFNAERDREQHPFELELDQDERGEVSGPLHMALDDAWDEAYHRLVLLVADRVKDGTMSSLDD